MRRPVICCFPSERTTTCTLDPASAMRRNVPPDTGDRQYAPSPRHRLLSPGHCQAEQHREFRVGRCVPAHYMPETEVRRQKRCCSCDESCDTSCESHYVCAFLARCFSRLEVTAFTFWIGVSSHSKRAEGRQITLAASSATCQCKPNLHTVI